MDGILPQIILVAVLTLVNAFFAAAEMAFVSINNNRINILAAQGDLKAQLLQRVLAEPTKLLSTIQVGITLAGFFSSASAATGIAGRLSEALQGRVPYAYQISLIIVTLILSYFTLVFGELFPKRLALRNADKIAMVAIRPVVWISKIALPFIKILSGSTNLLVRLFGLNSENLEERVTEEEIRALIQAGEETGIINPEEKNMLEGIFNFDDILARQIMIPRREVFMIDIQDSTEEIVDSLLESQFSRIPVYEDDLDNIIGVIYLKDLFRSIRKEGIDKVNIRELIREPYFVHETKNIDKLFTELKSNKVHMAILVDEYGGFSGILTMEDLIEEVMGNISDEYDENDEYIHKIDEFNYTVKGIIPLEDFNRYFHLNIQSSNVESLGGYIIEKLGKLPKVREQVAVKNVIFTVEALKHNRIDSLRMTYNSPKNKNKPSKEKVEEARDITTGNIHIDNKGE